MDQIEQWIEQGEREHRLNKEQLMAILGDTAHEQTLFAAADRVRQRYVGEEVHLRGLIEFTNICKQNCFYCGLRRDNRNVTRYRLEPAEIIDLAEKAWSYGYRTVVMQSGEGDCYSDTEMEQVLRAIKAVGFAITLSIGEKSTAQYEAYKQAGADRYLLRIETTDRELYNRLHPGMDFDNRVRCLQDLKNLGYEVGTGCLVGLPGQTDASLAEDILFFQSLDADMIGIGPFIPNADTPLADAEGGSFAKALKVMALTRLLLPDANVPATTAMETLNKEGRLIALKSGANVVMPNVTEGDYRRLYQLYPGKICINDTPAHCRGCITGKIHGIGRKVSEGYGYRHKR